MKNLFLVISLSILLVSSISSAAPNTGGGGGGSGGFTPDATALTDHANFNTDVDGRITTHAGTVDAHHDESPGQPGQVLINIGGVPSGDAEFSYNPTTDVLTVGAVMLPDNEGTNAHVLRGNELGGDYLCASSGAMTDGDLGLVSRLGDNTLYLCDENALAETDLREVLAYEFPGGVSVVVEQKSAGAGDHGLVVRGGGGDDTSSILRIEDVGLNQLCAINYLGIWDCDQFKNSDGSFNVNAAGRMQANQIQIYDVTANEIAGRLRKMETIPDDDYDLEFAQLSNGLSTGNINNGVRLLLDADGPVKIMTNTDDTTAQGLAICDDDNTQCVTLDPAANFTSDRTVDILDRSGTLGMMRGVRAETTAADHDIGANATTTALEAWGGYYHICNNASGGCNYILPAPVASATATMHICFGAMHAEIINVDMDDGVDLVRGGANCLAGESFETAVGTEGHTACIIAVDSNTWYLDESKGNFSCGS